MKDFFISYTGADKDWALWIAWALEEAGYSTIIDIWDFPKGKGFIDCMNEILVDCKRMIAVTSPEYWKANYTSPEWKYFFQQESVSKEIVMLLVEVRSSDAPPVIRDKLKIVLSNIINESKAKETLLQEIPKEITKNISQERREESRTKPSYPLAPLQDFSQKHACDKKFLYRLGNLNQLKQQDHFIDHLSLDVSCVNDGKAQGFIVAGSRQELPEIIVFTLAHLLEEILTDTPDIKKLKTQTKSWKIYKNKPEDFLLRCLYLGADDKQRIRNSDDIKEQIKEQLKYERTCNIFYREIPGDEAQDHDFLSSTLLAWSKLFSQETETEAKSKDHFLLLVFDTDLLRNSNAVEQWKGKMEESLTRHNLHSALLPPQTSPTINEDLTNWMISWDIDHPLRETIYDEFKGIEEIPFITLKNKLCEILKDYSFDRNNNYD